VGSVDGLAPGFYLYQPSSHSLRLVATGDKRAELDEKAVGQSWMPIAKATAVFVISGNAAKVASSPDPAMKERGRLFMWVEAGLAAQGFFLQAAGMGLGSTYVGGFRPAQAHEVLGLAASEEVMAILPVGRRP
jgi:SagB-type dehydrogenase family enzyme